MDSDETELRTFSRHCCTFSFYVKPFFLRGREKEEKESNGDKKKCTEFRSIADLDPPENALKFKKSTHKNLLIMILIIEFPCIKSHYKETFEYDAVLFLCNDLFYTTITNQLVQYVSIIIYIDLDVNKIELRFFKKRRRQYLVF